MGSQQYFPGRPPSQSHLSWRAAAADAKSRQSCPTWRARAVLMVAERPMLQSSSLTQIQSLAISLLQRAALPLALGC